MRRSSRWQRLLLVGAGVLVGLLLAETGARAVAAVRESRVRADWERLAARGEPTRLPAVTPASFGDVVRLSDDPEIVYELLPNLDTTFLGVPFRTNAQGFRDAAWPPVDREPGSLRLCAIGDSVLFGWGVPFEQTWLQQLRETLAAALPGRSVEVLNTGVPGYNTAMAVASFVRKALPHRPDVVVVDWVGNDADLPSLIPRESTFLDVSTSYLLDLVRELGGRHGAFADSPLQRPPFATPDLERAPERVPRAYRHMVGEPGVARALRRLRALADEHGFGVVVATHHDAPPFVHRLCADLGVRLVTNRQRVEEHLDGRDYLTSDLVLAGDPHPSAKGHAVYAETLAAHLLQSGVLQR